MKFRTSTTLGVHLPVVLLPGWATDYRVFDRAPFRPQSWSNQTEPTEACSTVVPLGTIDGDFSKDLADHLHAEGLTSVTLYGWSLGGAAALTFARAYPELVDEIVLVGVRPCYPVDEIVDIRLKLNANKKACLAEFYGRCFLPGRRDDYRWFKSTLLSDYLERWTKDELLRGLDYLQEASFDAEDLLIRPTSIIHGALDVIAPVNEIVDIAKRAEVDRVHIIPGAAHAVFLNSVPEEGDNPHG